MEKRTRYPHPRLRLKGDAYGDSAGRRPFSHEPPEIMGQPRNFRGAAIQTIIATKDGSKLANFHSPSRGVNGDRNMEFLAAIRIEKRVFWRVDGLAAISAGSSRNHGPPSTISRTHHPDPNRGYGLIRFDQFSVSPTAIVGDPEIRNY